MRTRAVVAIAILFALRCSAPVTSTSSARSNPTDDAFVRGLLTTWLVERDVARTRTYLASDFFVHPSLQATLTSPESALRFAHECPNAPRSCARLEGCIRSYELDTRTVDATMIEANPQLRSRAGSEIVLVSFTLEGCNLGTMLVVDKNAPDDRRVVMLVYLAG